MLQDAATTFARVAELVDALDLGSSGATRESSSLSSRTIGPLSGQLVFISRIPVTKSLSCHSMPDFLRSR